MNLPVQVTPTGNSDDVFLFPDARLEDVPESHRFLLSDEVCRVFRERSTYFESLSKQCELDYLQAFCHEMSQCEHWALQLCKSNAVSYFGKGLARFRFLIGATVDIADSDQRWWGRIPSIEIRSDSPELPEVVQQLPYCFREFYSLFKRLSFDEFGGSIFWHQPVPASDCFDNARESQWVFHSADSDRYIIDVATERIHCRYGYGDTVYDPEGEPADSWVEQYFSSVLAGVGPLPGI